jgi:hypothetical protein
VDTSVFKDFIMTERFHLQFRAEAFNIENRANFNPPNTTTNPNATEAVSSTVTFGKLTSAADPRVLQFALKLFF